MLNQGFGVLGAQHRFHELPPVIQKIPLCLSINVITIHSFDQA